MTALLDITAQRAAAAAELYRSSREERMSGRQMESLRDALCSAFDQNALDQMRRLRLDKDRTHLVGSGSLSEVVFNVIEIAVREGWHAELIRTAISYNPGNLALRRFCEEHEELLVKGGDLAAGAPIADAPRPGPKMWTDRSKAFGEDRQRTYNEMWERVERLAGC
jgi:hypothetical protein